MKHLIETENPSGLPTARYDRIILNSATDDIIVRGGEYEYELVTDSYIYNEADNKYYQKLVGYGEPIKTNATVDLNSQWVSDTTDDEYKYFKSDSYNAWVDEDGYSCSYSQCKVTWSNLTSITFKYMSSSDMGGLYVLKMDSKKFTPPASFDDIYLSTSNETPGTYNEFTIECDEGEHHIWFCYIKFEGATGEDRGFIGVPKSVSPILDIKQGAELPMEYKYGGVSAEGGKTYNISFNSVTLPNGSIIVPSYEDYTKTEKTITYEYVDLGLPNGTLWATCNIGASSETEDGVFFQWGDISGISGSLVGKYSDENYSWATAPFNGGNTSYNAGVFNSVKDTACPNGILAKKYDAAAQIMGGDWRMPTLTDFQELLNGTTNEWITDYNRTGVSGRKFTSKANGNSIFIPAAGNCDDGSVGNVGSYGNVWGSSLSTSDPSHAGSLAFISDSCYVTILYRCYGRSVRGVRK